MTELIQPSSDVGPVRHVPAQPRTSAHPPSFSELVYAHYDWWRSAPPRHLRSRGRGDLRLRPVHLPGEPRRDRPRLLVLARRERRRADREEAAPRTARSLLRLPPRDRLGDEERPGRIAWLSVLLNRDVTAFRRRISSDIVHQAIAVVMLSLGLILLVTLLLTISEHARAFPFLALLFEVTSAFGTVGLSMGITSELSELGKLIVTLTMFIGRLGPLTFAFAMTLRSAQNNIRYPEDKVLIG